MLRALIVIFRDALLWGFVASLLAFMLVWLSLSL
jgi:hypothetical protein